MSCLIAVIFLLSAFRCVTAPNVWVGPFGDGIITDNEGIEEFEQDE